MAITSAFQADDAGSIPAARSSSADIAQLVERTLGKGEVGSSNLPISTSSVIHLFRILILYQQPLVLEHQLTHCMRDEHV